MKEFKEEFIFGVGEVRTKEEWKSLHKEMMSNLYKAISQKNKEEKEELSKKSQHIREMKGETIGDLSEITVFILKESVLKYIKF